MTGLKFDKPIIGIESLTPNELKVLKLVIKDLDNEEIGKLLGVKSVSVRTYLRDVYDKMGFFGHDRKKRSKLIVYAKKELGD